MGNGCSRDEEGVADDAASSLISSNIRQQREELFDDESLASIRDQKYDAIFERCVSTNDLWVDPLFPPSIKSVYRSGRSPFHIQWMRPKEMYKDLASFYVNGPSRFDLVQGDLGDCWLLAAAASIASRPELVAKVIPDHRYLTETGVTGFEEGKYAGVFRFRFFHFGEWIEVCVDDLLPVYRGKLLMVHSRAEHEFWGALMEKAYAKLMGCYENLKGGMAGDALTDLTGGVCERYNFEKVAYADLPFDLPALLDRAVQRRALMCTGIWGDAYRPQVMMPNGLVTGHAYTITAFEVLDLRENNERVCLVRIRNPWGNQVEWRGRWSDASIMWNRINYKRGQLLRRARADGEFWMDVRDFVHNFDDLEVCNLTADDLKVSAVRAWHASVHSAAWLMATGTAGGRMKYKASFARNPQFDVHLFESTDESKSSTSTTSLLVELTQKHRRKGRHVELNIGFVIFALSPSQQLPVEASYLDSHTRVAGVDFYSNARTIAQRFELPAGRYLIVPSTWSPGEEGYFMLRVWSEAAHECTAVECPYRNVSNVSHPPLYVEVSPSKLTVSVRKTDPNVLEEASKYFRLYAGRDMRVTATELQEGLNKLFAETPLFHLREESCRALICVFDQNGTVGLHWHHFYMMYEWLRKAIDIYSMYGGSSKSGQANVSDLVEMVRSHDVSLWPNEYTEDEQLVEMAHFTFGNPQRKLTFNSFVLLLCRLESIRGSWVSRKRGARKLCLNRHDLMSMLLKPM